MINDKLSQLISSISRNDDQAASAEIYRYFFPGLLSFAHSIVKDKFVAEEIIEDIFVKLWDNKKALPTVQNLSHYLYVSVKHASLNFISRKSKPPTVEIGDDFSLKLTCNSNSFIEKENIAKINEAINLLPKKCRLIFRLVKEEGLKYKEVAQILDVSVKTIDSQMYIAFHKITEYLKIALPEFNSYFQAKKK